MDTTDTNSGYLDFLVKSLRGPGLGSEPQPAPDLGGTGNSSPQDEVAQETLPSVAPQRRESTPTFNQSGSGSSPIVSRRRSQQSLDALLRPRSSTIPLPGSAPQSLSASRTTSIASDDLRSSLDVISSAAHPISAHDAHSPVPSISSSYAGPTAESPAILDAHLIPLPPSSPSSARSTHAVSAAESLPFPEPPPDLRLPPPNWRSYPPGGPPPPNRPPPPPPNWPPFQGPPPSGAPPPPFRGPRQQQPRDTIRIGRGISPQKIDAWYKRRIRRLRGVLDHLANGKVSLETSRHGSGKVTILDSGPSLAQDRRHELSSDELKTRYHRSAALWNVRKDVTRRLIIIEDLNPWLIKFCVVKLGITPEFFEEHLINSGYTNGRYDDVSAKDWKTSGLKKSFISLKWYRPVWRLPVAPFSKQDLEVLLDFEDGGLESTNEKSENLVRYQAKSNVLRSQWDLWTDLNTTTGMERLCGWEERASIWKGKAGVDLVVLLLDPLPILEKTTSPVVREISLLDRFLADNINLGPQSSVTSSLHSSASSSQQSSATSSLRANSNTNVDPEAALGGRFGRSNTAEAGNRRIVRRLNPAPYMLPFLWKGATKKPESPQNVTDVLLIKNPGARIPPQINMDAAFASRETLALLRRRLSETESTLSSFQDALEGIQFTTRSGDLDLLGPLLEVIRHDNMRLLEILLNILNEITMEVLDDDKMEERLTIWRRIITRAQLELPEMRRSMLLFFTFLPKVENLDTTAATNSETDLLQPELQRCIDEIDQALRKLQETSSSLTSNMGLLDSRRSIAEAQSVTKLTELAFFFVPLGFAASVLGMQIEQFENSVPLSIFIVIAVSCTGFSYGIRLTIRSVWFRVLVQGSRASIKAYAEKKQRPVQRGNIPTFLFLRWLGQFSWLKVKESSRAASRKLRRLAFVFWKLLLYLGSPFEFIIMPLVYIALICIIPLSILWTQKIDNEIRVAMTVPIVSISSVLVLAVYWKSSRSEVRHRFFKLIVSGFRGVKDGNSRLFVVIFIFGGVCVFFLPIIFIWLKPISSGIQVSLTIALALIILIALISCGIYRLVAMARG